MNSHQVTQGVDRAPHRSLFFAAGFTEEELERPLIGVVSAKSEIIPGHMHLDKLAEAVKAGIKAGDIIKQVSAIAGGSGGGKPDSAMGGGKDPMMVDNALAIVDNVVSMKLGL